jgi:hypothetical protein
MTPDARFGGAQRRRVNRKPEWRGLRCDPWSGSALRADVLRDKPDELVERDRPDKVVLGLRTADRAHA